MIKLRGHHLICLHFYKGEGYSEEFIENLNSLMERARLNEKVKVVDGADDVCACCPYLSDKRCMHKTNSEQAISQLDDTALQLLDLKPGEHVQWADVNSNVMSTSKQWFTQFCSGCDWESLCRKNQS